LERKNLLCGFFLSKTCDVTFATRAGYDGTPIILRKSPNRFSEIIYA
jgi:hypothetical protein